MNTLCPASASASNDGTSAMAHDHTVTGRSVFAVETTAAGVAVQTALLSQVAEGQVPQLLALPALFPDQAYALEQIDRLRAAVVLHFAQAASIGVQALARHAAQQAQAQAGIPGLSPAGAAEATAA